LAHKEDQQRHAPRVPEAIGLPVGLFGVDPFVGNGSESAPSSTPAADEAAATASG